MHLATVSTRSGSSEAIDDYRLATDELRAEVLQPFAIGVALAAPIALDTFFIQGRLITWWPALSLILTGGIVFRLARLASGAAAFALIVALWLTVTGCIVLRPSLPLAPLYGLIVVSAAFLLGTRVAIGIAACSLVVLLGAAQISPGLVAPDVRSVALFMIGASTILSSLLARTFHAALQGAWMAHAQAEGSLAEARLRQGELGRVTKSLNETLAKLEELTRRLEEARAAAEKARRLKAEFAAAVSHELRTPLNIIIGFAEMLVAPRHGHLDGLPEACRGQVEAIYRNACHISNLVDDILELSQIDASRLALHKETLYLQEVVAEAVALVENLFRDEGLYLSIDIPPTLPPLYADRTRLRQVLTNLFTNASRFTEEGGVTVSAHANDHEVVVAVSDTGIGIAPEHLLLLFQEFRLHIGRGSGGLGLSISKRLIELHGGNMWVESSPDHGSTFYFSLPLTEAVVANPDGSYSLRRSVAAITSRDAQRTLLVVDDDERASSIIGRYLDGYRVQRMESIDRARRVLEARHAAGLVICNAGQYERWKKTPLRRSQRYPVVFCPLKAGNEEAHQLEVAYYLTKPISATQLRVALKSLGVRWRSVVLVEDDPDMAELLAQMLRSLRRGCQVQCAANGQDGLALLRQHQPDVLVLDLLMPGKNGYEVIREVRRDETLRRIPVIVITGAEDRDERVMTDLVAVTRPGGLTVGEAIACLKGSLDSLLIEAVGSDQE